MKKVVLSLAVLFSVAMISCGNSKKAEADSPVVEESATEVVEEVAEVATDSPVADSPAAEAPAEAPAETPAK